MRDRTEYQPQRMFEGHRHTSQQQWQWPSFSLSFWVCVCELLKNKSKRIFFPIDIFFFNSTDLSFRHTHTYTKKPILFIFNKFFCIFLIFEYFTLRCTFLHTIYNKYSTCSYASFLRYYITKMSFWCTSISKWKHIIKVVMMSASFGWSASLVEMWSGYIIFRRSNMTIYVPPYVYLYLCRLLVGTHFLWFNLILNAGYVQYIYEV